MNRSQRAILKGLLLIASLAGLTLFIRATDLAHVFDATWADTHLRGPAGPLVFLAIGTLIMAAGLPRQVISFIGGYAFGFLAGSLLTLAASAAGCLITLSYARFLGQDFIRRRRSKKIQKLNAVLSANPFKSALLIRFLPVGSNLLTNLAGGVSNAHAGRFVLGSAVGYIPQTVVFSLLGTGIRVNSWMSTGLSVLLFLFSSVIGYTLYRRSRLDCALDNGNGGNGDSGENCA